MRGLFVTDSRYREATINVDRSARALRRAVYAAPERVLVGQGFIGATPAGRPTTLGREGSDYSAAMAGYLLDAGSVTIWKDVDGILSADPRLFADTMLIPELSYLDAIELAYAGAQVIHPKTIKPLQNKNIPLYVRPFGDPTKPGSVICASSPVPPGVPVRILKGRQAPDSDPSQGFFVRAGRTARRYFFGIRPIPTENQPDPELGRQSERC